MTTTKISWITKIKVWIKTNKTTIAGILFAILTYLNVQDIVTMQQTVLITAILGFLGFVAAKDATNHSTSQQVAQATVDSTTTAISSDDNPVEQMTEQQRLAIDVKSAGVGYTCYQIDTKNFPIGYYQINTNLTWDYLGTRPPHR
jgi:hypothetical protein